jgi:hypothetical protein
MLRGLRRELPGYVEQCLSGDVPEDLARHVGGVVLIHL